MHEPSEMGLSDQFDRFDLFAMRRARRAAAVAVLGRRRRLPAGGPRVSP
jgi:hypothetical protein